jgi:hypothetical protein
VALSLKVQAKTVLCGHPRGTCRRRGHQSLQGIDGRRGSPGIYLGLENRTGSVVDAIADTLVSFEDHAAHRASNMAVLTELAASPTKRRAEEVLKPRSAPVVQIVSADPPAQRTRAKKLASLTAHLPMSPSSSQPRVSTSSTKPPPTRSALKPSKKVSLPAGSKGVGAATASATHPKTTSGPISPPGPTLASPTAQAPPKAPPLGSKVTPPTLTLAPPPPAVPMTVPPKSKAVPLVTRGVTAASAAVPPTLPPVAAASIAAPTANQAQTPVDEALLASINKMVQGLDSLRQSQERLVDGQKAMVDHVIQHETKTISRVVSSGAVSSLAADDMSSVPSTVVLDSHGRMPSSRARRWYALSVGRTTGIFENKDAALKSVLKFPHGCYKGFHVKSSAEEWLRLRRSTNKNATRRDDSSLKSSDSTHYVPTDSDDPCSSSGPTRPIDSILDVTKVGHDPSVGDSTRLFDTSTAIKSVLMKMLCPKGVTQAVRDQLIEASPDILMSPGKSSTMFSGASSFDAAALADSFANAVEQLSDVQAAKAGLTIPHDTQFKNPNRTYLNDKTLKSGEDLESSREDLESQSTEILQTMEATMSQILFVNEWTKRDIDLYLASGLLPNVMRLSMAHYQSLWLHLCTLTLKHPFNVVTLHIKHHANKLRSLRQFSQTRCRLLIRAYIYLRDAKHKNYRDQSISDKIMALAFPSVLSLKPPETHTANPEGRTYDCPHCMSDKHLRVPCPAKRLRAKRAKELAVIAARTITTDLAAFDKLCQNKS